MVFQRLRRKLSRGQVKTLSSLNAYAKWAQTYPPYAHNPLMKVEEGAMLAQMPDLAGKYVLDLACGTGRYSQIALARGAEAVIACDNALAMLQVGRDVETKPLYLGATTAHIPLEAHMMDVVLCGLAIGHVQDIASTLQEISRVLKPGGVALVSDFHPFLSLTGKKRLFTAPDGKVYAVEHYTHLIAQVFSVADHAGMRMLAIDEPLLPVDEQEIPIVVVYKLQKR